MRVTRTYWVFYIGFGVFISVSLVLQAGITLATQQPCEAVESTARSGRLKSGEFANDASLRREYPASRSFPDSKQTENALILGFQESRLSCLR